MKHIWAYMKEDPVGTGKNHSEILERKKSNY